MTGGPGHGGSVAGAPERWPLQACALFMLLSAVAMLILLSFKRVEGYEIAAFFIISVAGPFVAGAAWAWLDRRGPAGWQAAANALVAVSVAGLIAMVAAALAERYLGLLAVESVTTLVSLSILLTAAAALGALLRGRGLPAVAASPRLGALLAATGLAAALLFLATFAPLHPDPSDRDYLSPLFALLSQNQRFVVFFGVACIAALGLQWLTLLPVAGWLPRGVFVIAMLTGLLLFDDGPFVDYPHYQAYVAPALYGAAGGVPMVDVYCQYGFLPWFLARLGYEFLPHSFGSFSLVFRPLTVAWYLVFIATCYLLSRNRLYAVLCASVMVLYVVTFHEGNYNMSSLPSTQGYRYLWPMVMVLVLAPPWAGPRSGLLSGSWPGAARALGIALVAGIAALWSFETLLFALGPPAAMALLEGVRSRSIARGARILLPGVLGAVAAHLLLVLSVLAVYGRWVDYRPYLELIWFFSPGGNNVNSWSMLVPRHFGLWMAFALAFFVPLAVATREALGGVRRDAVAWSLVPVAVLGVAQASYFLGRSTITTLGLALMPFLVIVIVYSERYAVDLWRSGIWRRWPERLLLALALAFLFAFPLERFSRPYKPDTATATVLRRCFSDSGCWPSDVFAGILRQAGTTASSMSEEDLRYAAGPRAGELKGRLAELTAMIRVYYPEPGARVPLIVDERTMPYVSLLALADSGTWYFWPIASSMNDFISQTLAERAIGSADRLRDGDVLLVERKREILYEPLQQLLAAIEARCRLRPEREGDYFRALVLADCRTRS